MTASLFVALLLLAASRAESGTLSDASQFPPPNSKLLVVSPHPDDETLGAGGLIARVLGTGGRVKVVSMTSGDGFTEGVQLHARISHPTADDYRAYAKLREDEARRALSLIGVTEADHVFLGFPDGGLAVLRDRYQRRFHLAYTSPFTELRQPSRSRMLIPDAQYTGTDLESELVTVIAAFRPTVVATTDPRDWHPDHAATHFFVSSALREAERRDPSLHAELLTFLVHFGRWPTGAAATRLTPPAGFPATSWIDLALTAAELERKREALLQYRSQLLMMRDFLLGFLRSNELYFPAVGESVVDTNPPRRP